MPTLPSARKLLAVVVVIVFSIPVSHPALAAVKPFQFTFNPPEGIKCIVSLKSTKVKSVAGRKSTDVASGTERMAIAKTATGYNVTSVPLSIDMTRDGNRSDGIAKTLADSFIGESLVKRLDGKGRCLSVSGHEQIAQKIADAMGAEAPPQLRQMLPDIIDAAVAKEMTEWNGRIAVFTGRKAKVGDVWSTTMTADMPVGGEIPMPTKIKFVKQVSYGGRNCMLISYKSSASGSAVRKFVQTWYERAAPGGAPGIKQVQMISEGQRLIDPSTMLIYSETMTRTSKIVFEGGSSGDMIEKRQYKYDYTK